MKARIQRATSKPQSIKINSLGHVRIGEKQKNANGKEYPVALDYFKIDGDSEDYNTAVREVYGDKPTTLHIAFFSDDMSECCNNYLELRDRQGKRVCRGDGQVFYEVRKVDEKFVDVLVTPDDPEKYMKEIEQKTGGKFMECLKLRFAIMGKQDKPIALIGTWELNTKGVSSTIKNIVGQIDTVFEIGGRIRMIPFDLHIKKVTSDKAGAKSSYPVLSLVCNLSVDRMDNIRSLPITGMITESKIAAITSGTPQPTITAVEPTVEGDYAEFEELKFDPADYCEQLAKANAADLNVILKDVKSNPALTDDDRRAVFTYVSGLGVAIFNKELRIFEPKS